jgi:hypothetical protein
VSSWCSMPQVTSIVVIRERAHPPRQRWTFLSQKQNPKSAATSIFAWFICQDKTYLKARRTEDAGIIKENTMQELMLT